MPEQNGALATIAETAASLLRPPEDRVEGGDLRALLAELGLSLPASVDANAALVGASQSLLQRLKALPAVSAALAAAIKSENIVQIVVKALELGAGVLNVVKDVEKLGAAIKGLPDGHPAARAESIRRPTPTRLVDYLAVRNLEATGGVADALDFVGFVERTDVPAADAQHPAYTRRAVHLDQLTNFLTDPAAALKAKYHWGAPVSRACRCCKSSNRC
jgi:hypothetical protein